MRKSKEGIMPYICRMAEKGAFQKNTDIPFSTFVEGSDWLQKQMSTLLEYKPMNDAQRAFMQAQLDANPRLAKAMAKLANEHIERSIHPMNPSSENI